MPVRCKPTPKIRCEHKERVIILERRGTLAVTLTVCATYQSSEPFQYKGSHAQCGSWCRTTYSSSGITRHSRSVADLLRGDYKQSEYGHVILPFTVIRRLD
ncbi:MAG: type I restriction-modification system subunit M N-terminal domain-containing protein [Rhodanobacter sp.]